MPLTNDGNERDVRLRPDVAPIPGADANLSGPIPVGAPCATTGTQTDLPPSGYSVTTPSGTYNQNYDWGDLSKLCPRGLDMRSVERVLFQIVVSHFSLASRIINPDLKDLIFNTNAIATKIRVDLNTTYNLATAAKLPAVILRRGEQKFGRISLNDAGERRFAPSTGETSFCRRVEGTHQLLCVSAVPGEAENLANELVDLFTGVSPVLRSELPFADFEVGGVGELQLSDELGNRAVVVVNVVYKYELGWTMVQATPLAVKLSFTTLVQTKS